MKEREEELRKDEETDRILRETDQIFKESRVGEKQLIKSLKKTMVKDQETREKIKQVNEEREVVKKRHSKAIESDADEDEHQSEKEHEKMSVDEEQEDDEVASKKEEEEREEVKEKKESKTSQAPEKKAKPLKGGENFCRINLKRGYKPRGQKSISYKAQRTKQRKARYNEFKRDMQTDSYKPCGGLGANGLDGHEITNETAKDNSIPSFSRGYQLEKTLDDPLPLPQTEEDYYTILQTHFGFNKFYNGQLDAIKALLET